MIISYKTKACPSQSTIKACDKATKAVQGLMVETAKIVNPWFTPIIWIMTRFYKRKIDRNSIEYNFYLFK